MTKLRDITNTRNARAQGGMTTNMMQNSVSNQGIQQPNFFPQTPMQATRSHQGEMVNAFTPNQMPNAMQPSPRNVVPQPMMQNTPMQAAMQQAKQPPQAPQQPPQQGQPQQRQNIPTGLTPQEHQSVVRLAQTMMGSVPKEQLPLMRERFLSTLSPQQREQLSRQNADPLQRHFYANALKKFVERKAATTKQGQGVEPQNSMGNQAMPNMQQPGLQQNGLQQSMQNSNQVPDLNNFSNFIGQQADAIKMQGAGELVVPASNNNNLNGMQSLNNNAGQLNMGALGQIPSGMNPMQLQQLLANRQAQMRNNQNANGNPQAVNAQAHAQAQAQMRNAGLQNMSPNGMPQLRGQPGGLNINQPPQRSPAMSMLNRPMVPPGQQPNGQGQQQNQPQAQQGQQQGVQQMANQANGQQQNLNNQNNAQRAPQFPANMPAALRQKLMTMPEDKMRATIMQWNNQVRNGTLPPGLNQNSQQPQQQQQAMVNPNANANNMGPQRLAGNQNGNQGAANQANGAAGTPAEQQQRNLANQAKLRAYDSRKIPPPLVNLLKLPDTNQTWAQAKQWALSNSASLPPGTFTNIQRYQIMAIQREERTLQQQRQQQQQGGQQTMQPGLPQNQQNNMTNSQMQPPMNGGQAPQAAMATANAGQMNAMNQMQMQPGPNGQLGNGLNMANFPHAQPTPQEMTNMRQKVPHFATMSEDQLRLTLFQMKLKNLAQRNPALFKQYQQQLSQAGQMQGGQQNNNVAQPPQQPAMQQQQPQQQRQMPGQQQPNNQQGMQPGQNLNAMGQQNLNQQQLLQQAQAQQQRQQNQGMAQPQNMAQGQLQQRNFPQLTPEQLSRLTPDQRRQFEFKMQQRQALMAAQTQTEPAGQQKAPGQPQQPTAHQAGTPQMRQRMQAMVLEADSSIKKGMPLQLDQNSLAQTVNKLKELLMLTHRTEQLMPVALINLGEDTVRKMLRFRALVYSQMHKDGNVNQYISIQFSDLLKIEQEFQRFITEMRVKQAEQARGQAAPKMSAPQQPSPAQQSPPQVQPQPAAPEMQRQTTQQNNAARAVNNRKASASRPPAAPTSEQPPFALSAPSPQGVPVYDLKVGFTPDKLQLPTKKKQKPTAAGTPTQVTSSPAVTPAKMASPEQKRTAPVKAPEPPKEPERRFKCNDPLCDFSIKGFEKEDELQKHVEEMHQKITDPLDFFLASVDEYLLKHEETEKAEVEVSTAAPKAKTTAPAPAKSAALGPATIKKEALKAEGKKDALTPASAAAASPASPSKIKKAMGTPQSTPKKRPAATEAVAESPKKQKTFGEHLAEKYGFTADAPMTDGADVKSAKAADKDAQDGASQEFDFMASFTQSLTDFDGSGFESVLGPDQMENWAWGTDFENVKTPVVEELPELTPDGSASNDSRGSEGELSVEDDNAKFWSFIGMDGVPMPDTSTTNDDDWTEFLEDKDGQEKKSSSGPKRLSEMGFDELMETMGDRVKDGAEVLTEGWYVPGTVA